LRSYCNATGAPIAIWTNGDQISYYQRKDPNYFEDIPGLPNASQTLADILQIKFTLEDLIANDKLVKENKSLKTLIEEMEDEVLANAGVDVFEELFKLIFTKLYDEWYSGQGNRRKTRSLEFRNTGQTEAALRTKIQALFEKAKEKWSGVFSEGAKISLTPSHLSVCVSSLENVKLFNSNLDVIDEAFEYLINQSSKGDKGQYFTPRYVIDMCVKMLNPKEDEYMIDTAAGSSGFSVHTMFHVWQQILADQGLEKSHLFTAEVKPPECDEYVKSKVFSIDFDEKAVRVARTLNLIAGDGEQNVLHLNTLDFELWDEVIQQDDWNETYNSAFNRLKKLRSDKTSYQHFKFDLVMANPPFAGDIKEPRMIARYDLAKKPDGKWQTKVGRDILFIERNLDFLKPGGRMAIVLPQGRFNNSSDKNIRDFIAERCRILAVVGLHGNTFKPHTGTKTSVLFVQKWNDDPKVGALCPRRDDYNIFFATMQKSGKDNSGEKIWRRVGESPPEIPPTPLKKGGLDSDSPLFKGGGGGSDFLKDEHGHLIVDHDLYNHEGLTEDGIAEAFIEFAKKEQLSFFEPSPSVTPFDAVKYQRLMDGLEVGSVNLSVVLFDNESFRFDSEYFQKANLNLDNLLNKFQTTNLFEIAKVSDGDHSKFPGNQREEVKYLQAKDIKKYFLEEYDPVYISSSYFLQNARSHIEGENILLSIMGTVGDITITPKDFEPCLCNRALAIIKKIKNIDPYFLFAYLITNQATSLINRLKNGGVQERVNLDVLGRVKVPLMGKAFQELVKNIVLFGYQTRKNSKLIYQQAEDLLLSELGLQNWQPTEETVAVKSFAESFLSSGRFDAEYYQPKFDQLIERLEEKVELTPLGDLLTLNQKGRQPDYVEEDQDISGCLPVINSKYVREGEVILLDNRYARWPENENPLIIQKNDVLFNGTGVGAVGRCATYFHDQEALPDTEVAVLRSDTLDPVYLSIYINSIAGQLQVQKHLQGSSGIIRVYPSDTEKFLIWNAPEPVQQKIRSKVEASHQKREQSKQLLEIAKTGVERAIETDEATATTWINQQLKALGLSPFLRGVGGISHDQSKR
jgi:type I restriction enzyme M protein